MCFPLGFSRLPSIPTLINQWPTFISRNAYRSLPPTLHPHQCATNSSELNKLKTVYADPYGFQSPLG